MYIMSNHMETQRRSRTSFGPSAISLAGLPRRLVVLVTRHARVAHLVAALRAFAHGAGRMELVERRVGLARAAGLLVLHVISSGSVRRSLARRKAPGAAR